MRLTGLVVLCVVVGALLVGWALSRFGVAAGALISFSARLLLQLTAGLLIAWTAVGAAERGGVRYAVLAAALGVLALGMFAVAGLLTWAALKYGIDPDDLKRRDERPLA